MVSVCIHASGAAGTCGEELQAEFNALGIELLKDY